MNTTSIQMTAASARRFGIAMPATAMDRCGSSCLGHEYGWSQNAANPVSPKSYFGRDQLQQHPGEGGAT